MRPRADPKETTSRRYPRLLIFLLGLALVLSPNLMVLPAYAEDPGELTLTKNVTGFTDGEQVAPGDTFVYTIEITCTNIGSGGCTSAELTDPLPDGISLDGGLAAISITPTAAGTPPPTGTRSASTSPSR